MKNGGGRYFAHPFGGIGRTRTRIIGAAAAGIVALATLAALPMGAAEPAEAVPASQPTAVQPAATAPTEVVGAAAAPVLRITYAARWCDNYTDVMANKARNNVQESLFDLGPDSNYSGSESVSVAKEDAGSPNCHPLTGWRFSTGSYFTGPTSASLDLSTVTGQTSADIVTQGSVPELTSTGAATGRTIEGAVTVQLTAEEIRDVERNALWIQGGTPSAPLNGLQAQYGFAALRCSQDALNGDNVEHVSYPQNTTHVFCYYYAITPPRIAGTITVVKDVAPGNPGSGTFRFDGNISYGDTNNDGTNDFLLTASAGQPQSQDFIRGSIAGSDPPWSFKEVAQSGWVAPSDPVCTTELGSQITVDGSGGVEVRLEPRDHVICTYTNSRLRTGVESLWKETHGNVGSFPFEIDVPDPGTDISTTVTTTEEGVAEVVATSPTGTPGTYTATETLPDPTRSGSWELLSVVCNDNDIPFSENGQDRTATFEVLPDQAANCLFTNKYTPAGSISIQKQTEEGTGPFQYRIVPMFANDSDVDPRFSQYRYEVTTTQEGVMTDATPIGLPANRLLVTPSVHYMVQEMLPPPTAQGTWQLVRADCGPNTVQLHLEDAAVEIELTEGSPQAVCQFTNVFVPLASIQVIKHTTDVSAFRPDPAQLALTCTDGTGAQFPVQPGVRDLEFNPLGAVTPILGCVVDEFSTGAGPGINVTTSATITVGDDPPQPYAIGQDVFNALRGEPVIIDVVNDFSNNVLPVDPPGGGGGTGGGTPPDSDLVAALPVTGWDPGWWLLAAALLVAAGATMVASGMSRRRTGQG